MQNTPQQQPSTNVRSLQWEELTPGQQEAALEWYGPRLAVCPDQFVYILVGDTLDGVRPPFPSLAEQEQMAQVLAVEPDPLPDLDDPLLY